MNSTRSYTLTSQSDHNHTANGRCPNYALNWKQSDNSKHWPIGHDYYIGNNNYVDDEDADMRILREILSEKLRRGTLPSKIIFCDLDGVLANFEEGVKNRFKKTPDKLPPNVMWGVINKSNTFFDTLPWMRKGRELWEEIKKYDPIILTGIPRGATAKAVPAGPCAAEQKRKWCARELGPDIHVITCATKDKPKYCLSNSILIDDRTDNLNAWNEKGGTFILYDEEFVDKIIERIHKCMEQVF